jgi:hypothetical protein
MESPLIHAEPVRLVIRNLGPMFNFKNSKLLTRGKTITDPELKKRMQAIVQSLELQLRCAIQTIGDETRTDARQRFLTHSLPQDDCWTCIPDLRVLSQLATDESDVGCDILIERIG